MAIDPMDNTCCLSKTGVQEMPPFSLSHTPPEAVPTKIRLSSDKSTSMAVTLPLIPAGPMFRAFMDLNWPALKSCAVNKIVRERKTSVNSFFILSVFDLIVFDGVKVGKDMIFFWLGF